jgi:hypothetical protein
MKSARMACRTAGKLGWGGGPLILFFPLCCGKAAKLQEGVGNHRHERVAVKPLPALALKVDANGGEARLEFSFGAGAPTDGLPCRLEPACLQPRLPECLEGSIDEEGRA